jgi:hypothetical protein
MYQRYPAPQADGGLGVLLGLDQTPASVGEADDEVGEQDKAMRAMAAPKARRPAGSLAAQRMAKAAVRYPFRSSRWISG